ncbi:MAG: hypothetical protein WAW88_03040 [Nocardioides sp.]
MTDHDTATTGYPVVLLVEQALSPLDARQVRSLHEGIDEPVTYHVLVPVDHAAERIENAMGTLAAGEVLAAPSVIAGADLASISAECRATAEADLAATLACLGEAGATATGEVVDDEPISALERTVAATDGREVIVLTRPHVVAEFFHVDWTSRARRHLGVPVLHLLEHETFSEQAGAGEGVTGL